jgi:hypothetical protein
MKKLNILSVAIAAATLFSASNVFAAPTATDKANTSQTMQVAEEPKSEEVQPEAPKEDAK